MRGVLARRRVAHFGFTYGYESAALAPGPEIPGFLRPLRERCASLAGKDPARLEEVLVTWYPPGAPIGWHRDAPGFGTVVGVSLLSPCRLRFRPGRAGRAAYEQVLEPRSAYVLAGAARWSWQHSIPAGPRTRYSVTFRTVREPGR
jgi:alkylated DNA repair dioxygenase AlkB